MSKSFDVPTMIAISDPWVDERKDKPVLLSVPLIAGLVPILEEAHNPLLRLQLKPSEADAAMRSLTEQALALDGEQDDRYRSLHSILTGWAAVSSEARRAILERLRDTLLPEGLGGTQRTYLAESGNVELAVSKMTPEMETTLKEIVVDGTTAFQLFNEWVELGRKLGDVERERARIAQTQSGTGVTAKDIQNARYRWIRAVNALSTLLELESDIPEDIRIRILQPLRAAEAKLAQKRAKIDPTEGLDPTEETDEDDTPIALSKAEA